ncbi:MAG: Ycf53-like protein [Chroococcopsis gigantea SAG 12.99]|jgi:hypothetical protein|nr:GUN4 N-terminal ARM-like repeat domain-containing protein [Chlorogloea purpurea SAG 13.99]MDV3001276.1 Ycf53-like protein [Chroococcopsis gigantea SAG 12.99]
MVDQNTVMVTQSGEDISLLASQLLSESEKNQLQLISRLAGGGEAGLKVLMDFLLSTDPVPVNLVTGKAYGSLYGAKTEATETFLHQNFPTGIVPLESDRHIDYRLLQELLAQQDFHTADSLTRQKMCELAGPGAMKRKWVYFTEVEQFPVLDLHTINSLWWIHSEGKFGFSVQRRLWLSVGQDFPKLWPKIGWKSGNNWTLYPKEFTWDLSAPVGHLPLLNQLRGVRVAASLFSHPVWTEKGW